MGEGKGGGAGEREREREKEKGTDPKTKQMPRANCRVFLNTGNGDFL